MMRLSNLGLVGISWLEWSQWAMTVTSVVQALSPEAFSLLWSKDAKNTLVLSFACPSLLTSSFTSQSLVVQLSSWKSISEEDPAASAFCRYIHDKH